MAGFQIIGQTDFAAGMFRGVARHHIPSNGVYDALNSLFDDDGQIYRRGGSEYKSGAAFGTAGIRWIWDGHLAPGQRTLFATPTSFGVLADDDVTVIDLGLPLTWTDGLANPTRAVQVGDLLFIGGGAVYGGSRKAGNYTTGTVTVTKGSPIVTGSGTSWLANVDAGMLMHPVAFPYYVVASVEDDTHLTLTEPYSGTTSAGIGYSVRALGHASNHSVGFAGAAEVEIYATIADRLIEVVDGRSLRVSGAFDLLPPATVPQYQTYNFDPTDLQQYAGEILGVEALRDTLMVFTVNGIFALTGLAFDETDDAGNPQWTSELINADAILWSKEGVATYRNELIVPCTDGVWSIGITSAPRLLSRSINTGLYLPYVRDGNKTGLGAVYGNHYFLPILDVDNNVVDQLVCRLDRPVQTTFGECFPWARLGGHGGNIAAWTVRSGRVSTQREPLLLAGSRGADSRVLNMTPVFTPAAYPDAIHKSDADGSAFAWQMISRDYSVGPLGSTVRRLRMGYQLVEPGDDVATILAWYSRGSEPPGLAHWDEDVWDEFVWAGDESEYTALTGTAPEDTGRNPHVWDLAADTRYVRARLRSSTACAQLKLRSLEWFLIASGRQ